MVDYIKKEQRSDKMITNFLDLSVWLFEFLVMTLLPIVSLMLAVLYIVKIGDAAQFSMGKFMKDRVARLKNMGK